MVYGKPQPRYLERSNPSWNKELQKQILETQQQAQLEEEVIVVEYLEITVTSALT